LFKELLVLLSVLYASVQLFIMSQSLEVADSLFKRHELVQPCETRNLFLQTLV